MPRENDPPKRGDAPTVRAFLAIETPASARAAMAGLKSELASTRTDVRWVRDEGLHATLKFLGPVPAATLAALRDRLAPLVAPLPHCPVEVRGLGVFPNLRRARVIWVGLHGDGLAALARTVDEAATQLGFAPETRPFQAHVTLGRVRSPKGWARLEEALHAHWNDDFGSGVVEHVVAFRSDLRPDGSVYTKLWTTPLLGNT